MVVVSYSGKEINAKLVYYGPGLSGKTTNLEHIYKSVPSNNRGKMVSMKTRTERTLFFDFLPVDLGELGGFKTRFLLYTVPGQVYYNATRKLVLRGVDALIFVADSERGKMDENLDSLQNLRDNLKEYGLRLEDLPWVIQYNKRDLPEVYTIEELEQALNPTHVPWFEATAMTGQGVFETFRGVSRLVLQKLSKEVKLGEGRVTQKMAQAAPVRPEVAAPVSEETASTPLDARAPSPTVKMPTPLSRGATGSPPPVREPVEAASPVPATTAAESASSPVSVRHPIPTGSESLRPRIPEYDAPSTTYQVGGSRGGFWSRLFGRGRDFAPSAPDHETRLATVDLPRVGGAGNGEPVVIEKRIQVPITLGPEELVRGARLRLVLEVQVQPISASQPHAPAADKVA